jgi:hypothetical protein
MSKFVQQTKDIGDAASLTAIVNEYLDADVLDVDEVLAALRNIIQRVADDHHQSRAMAVVAIKLINGVTE